MARIGGSMISIAGQRVARMRTDYLVIGRGIAGLRAAIELAPHGSVLVVSKRRDASTTPRQPRLPVVPRMPSGVPPELPHYVDQGSSEYAQGGIAVALGPGDSAQQHIDDTIAAARGLCDPDAVNVLVTDGLARVRELIDWGVPFDRRDGRLHFTRESAHRRPRILHAHGDATGEVILHTLLSRLQRRRRVQFANHHFTIDLLVAQGRCRGALILDEVSRRLVLVSARAVILATGGAGQLYQRTTNPAVCTGDGMAIAYRAGARLQDLEFVQFHPTTLATTTAPAFLITEAIRGEGAVIRDRRGRRFLFDHHRAGELAPRDVVARAIWTEMHRHRQPWVWLDATHLDPAYLRARFPTVDASCLRHGLDLTKEQIPVCPAAHFFMGGVATDRHGASTVEGLFAAGEVACSGIHGANRLASNSLLEGLVFGCRAARAVLRRNRRSRRHVEELAELKGVVAGFLARDEAPPAEEIALRRAELQQLMWQRAGVIRNGRSLQTALSRLDHMREDEEKTYGTRAGFEYRNLLVLARLIVRAAARRRGSVGAHYRSDYTGKGAHWRRHLSAARAAQGVTGEE